MNKIETLKATIVNLENGMEYNWQSCNNCNCGVVAKTLLNGGMPHDNGLCHSTVRNNNIFGSFSKEAYCLTSYLPLPLVFQKFKDVGFTFKDIQELEFLGNELILKKIGEKFDFNFNTNIINNQKYAEKEYLLKYLKAWVEILEKESNVVPKIEIVEAVIAPTPIAREKIVYVSVPESIVTIAEIILS